MYQLQDAATVLGLSMGRWGPPPDQHVAARGSKRLLGGLVGSERFRFLDHTGDLAIRLWGDDPADLLRSGGIALFRVIAGDVPIHEVHTRRVTARGADLEELLVGWMNRLLLLYSVDGLLLSRFDPSPPRSGRVQGIVKGESHDPRQHGALREVKAVTYHGLQVERQAGRLTATVVLDL